MNKYEKELLKNISYTATVYELTRHQTESAKDSLLDMLLGNLFTTIRGMKSATKHGANYLVIDHNKAELYHITSKFHIQKHDVTQIVNAHQTKKYFIFDGYKYVLYKEMNFA